MTVSDITLPKGIYTPIPTYFLDDGNYSVDTKTQIEHAAMLYKAGIQGLVVSGSMGEASNLEMKERVSAIKELRDAIPDKNFKLIAGVSPQSYKDVITESKLFADAGADFLIVLVPGFFGPNLISQQGIVDYFVNIADGSALPLIIYNYPNTCNGVDIEYETFVRLSEHPNIVGVKLTHFNLSLYTLLGQDKTLEENNFRSLTGLGQVLIPALSIGLTGAIDGLSGIFPKSMLELLRLYTNGKMEKATELQFLVTQANLMISELNVVGVKHALFEIYGYGKTLSGRPPLSKSVNLSAYKKYDAPLKALLKYEQTL